MSLFEAIKLEKIISGANNTVSFVNKAIPIYKQVTPIVKNVRSAWSSINSVRNATKEAIIKDIKSFERPTTIFKKTRINEERGEINLDTLTFFQ